MPEWPNPYVGARPFSEADSARFAGRAVEIRELTSLIVAQREVVLFAESGAGKSSLLRAGVVPRLRARGFEVLPTTRVYGYAPGRTTGDPIGNIYAYNALGGWPLTDAQRANLPRLTLREYFQPSTSVDPAVKEPRLRVLIIDQFEELFTKYPERWRDREAFLADLAAALDVDRRLRVLIAIREEYVGRLRTLGTPFPDGLRTWFHLERLRQPAAIDAVALPARQAQRTYADGVAEELVARLMKVRVRQPDGHVDERAGEFADPVYLQVVCSALWERLPADATQVTRSHLVDYGDADAAMRAYYQRELGEVARTHKPPIAVRRLEHWFERRLITEDNRRARLFESDGKVGGLPATLVDELQRRYLIRADVQEDRVWYELAHDRLVDTVRQVQASRRARWRPAMLGAAAAVLVVFVAGLLYTFNLQRQLQLAQTQATLSAADVQKLESELTDLARQIVAAPRPGEYLDAMLQKTIESYPYLDKLKDPALLKDALQRAANGRLTALPDEPPAQPSDEHAARAGAFPDATDVFAGGFSPDGRHAATWESDPNQRKPFVAVWEMTTYRRLATRDQIRPVTAIAIDDGVARVTLMHKPGIVTPLTLTKEGVSSRLQSILDKEKAAGRAPLAAADAQQSAPDWAVYSLTSTAKSSSSFGLLAVAPARSGELIATAGWDGRVVLWATATKQPVRTLEGGAGAAWDVAFSPDDALVAAGMNNGSVILWNVKTGERQSTLASHRRLIRRVAFNQSGELVAGASWDGTITIWNVKSGTPTATLSALKAVNGLAFDPVTGRLASGGADGFVRMWDLSGGRPSGRPLPKRKGPIRDVQFAPDGRLLASAGADGAAVLWTPDGKIVRELKHNANVWSAAFSPDGARLVTGSADGFARVWEVSTGKLIATLGDARRQAGGVNSARFLANSNQLLTVASDDTCRWWNLDSQREFARVWGHAAAGGVAAAAVDPTGTVLALADRSGRIHLLRPPFATAAMTFESGQGTIYAAAFSPDGRTLATVGAAPPLKVWDAQSGTLRAEISQPTAVYRAVTFDASGGRVAASRDQAPPVVWSMSDRSVQQITNGRAGVARLALSPAGDLVAGAGDDQRIRVWSLKSGVEIADVPVPSPVLELAFVKDSDQFAMVSAKGLRTSRTSSFAQADVARVIGSSFERLSNGYGSLNRAIRLALSGATKDALQVLVAIPAGAERRKVDSLRLIERLRDGTFTPLDLRTYFVN